MDVRHRLDERPFRPAGGRRCFLLLCLHTVAGHGAALGKGGQCLGLLPVRVFLAVHGRPAGIKHPSPGGIPERFGDVHGQFVRLK